MVLFYRICHILFLLLFAVHFLFCLQPQSKHPYIYPTYFSKESEFTMTITNINMPGPSPPTEEVPITIVGAGPVGMLLAYQLDRLNVPCLLAEQSLHTTKWPKMDLTNCRVMEMLRVLGLADEYRALEGSVGPDDDFDSLFVTKATGDGKILGAWVGLSSLVLVLV